MSCYACGTHFGAFKKEHGCKNCGFAFCKNCLQHKIEIPKMKNEKHRVCVKCYNIMTGKVKPKDEPARYSPPENFKKRVAALKEREAAGHTGAPHHSRTGPGVGAGAKAQYKGMSQADIQIQQRLEKLREKTPQEIAASKVTSDEIDDRLARLKGMDPSQYKPTNKPTYHPPDRRTQQEQMNDLLDEISNEVDLDAQLPDPTLQIENRLAKLKDNPETKQTEPEDSNENNLNKLSMRDSQTFAKNISNNTSDKPSSDTKPQQNSSAQSPQDETTTPEDVKRILNEAAQELEEDAQKALRGLQQDKEIMKKLQDIKKRRKQSNSDINRDDDFEDSNSENEDRDEAIADDIIKQALEEAKLDEAAAKDGVDLEVKAKKADKSKKTNKKDPAKKLNNQVKVDKDEEWYDPDELPYCCICTEDAVVRCIDCDMDLYCSKCFRDGHKELGLTDHRTKKYTPPKEELT